MNPIPEELQALFNNWTSEALKGWEFGHSSGYAACQFVLDKAKTFYEKKIDRAYKELAELQKKQV